MGELNKVILSGGSMDEVWVVGPGAARRWLGCGCFALPRVIDALGPREFQYRTQLRWREFSVCSMYHKSIQLGGTIHPG